METLQTILLILQVLCALVLIGFILIQHGKGADAGAAFGSGASTTVFGAQGSGNFLSRTTAVLAFVFLLNSLALAWIAKERSLEARRLNLNFGAPAAVEQPVTEPDVVGETPDAAGAFLPEGMTDDTGVPTVSDTESGVGAIPE